MTRAIVLVVCALCVVLGCGGAGGAKKTAVDSGASNTTSGGASGGAGGSSGGTGGNTRSDAGSGGAASAATNGDASKADTTATGEACPAFTPCGGDLVGKWRLNTNCPWEQASGWCSEFVAEDRSGMRMDYTFASDGSFTVSYSGAVRETSRVPFKCFASTDAGAAQICAGLQESAQSELRADAGSKETAITAITCSADPTGCVCDMVLAIAASTKTGTYSAHNAELILSFATDAAWPNAEAPAEYCVSGNTLAIHSYDGNGKAGTNWFVK